MENERHAAEHRKQFGCFIQRIRENPHGEHSDDTILRYMSTLCPAKRKRMAKLPLRTNSMNYGLIGMH